MSIDEFASTTPVRSPIVNRNTNPSAHKQAALYVIRVPYNVANHLKVLIPVGTGMIIVADVKYARVSTSIPPSFAYFLKSGSLSLLERPGAVQTCNGSAPTFNQEPLQIVSETPQMCW
jgi:hypothetical protein